MGKKICIVTGASRGMGRGIALVLAKHGANIAFTYSRSVDSAITLTEEITSLSVKCKAYQSNAANFEDSQKLIEQVLLDFETIDVLINNAGITKDNLLMRMNEEDFDKAVEDLRLATRDLGKIVGKVDVEEILGSIFDDFCIGK